MGDRRMRVLFFSRAPFVSGAERALMTMLRGLDRSRVEPAVIVGTEELSSPLRNANVPYWIVPFVKREFASAWAWWRSLNAMRAVVREFQPDIVHSNDVPSCQAMSLIAGKLGIPRVIHVRWPVDSTGVRWWARGGAEQAICISRWIAGELGEATPGCSITVDPDPITWTDAPGVSLAGERTGDELVLGFAGQLIRVKGLEILMRALATLGDSRRFRLFIAGEDRQTGGAYQAELQKLAAELGIADRIEWLGFLPNVDELYRRVDAVVCPSLVEPLGLVPLEAARFSLPALVSNVGGFPETVEHGVTGWLAPPTVEGWRETLKSLPAADVLREIGETAHRRIRRSHDLQAYCERLVSRYETLLERRRVKKRHAEPETASLKNVMPHSSTALGK